MKKFSGFLDGGPDVLHPRGSPAARRAERARDIALINEQEDALTRKRRKHRIKRLKFRLPPRA